MFTTLQSLFQFHYGSIKIVLFLQVVGVFFVFQFHYGSIKIAVNSLFCSCK